jgi:sugar/nucleoside kinase (ribokinase family)
MSFDVFGMCNAIYDLQAEVEDAVLEELDLQKGSMRLLEAAQQRRIVPRVYTHIVHSEAGGSGANTMFGVALLGGTACFTSRVGSDEHARLYREGLAARGVKANLGAAAGDTGVCLIFVTPDAERTMCTYLGCSRELEAGDVHVADLRASKYLYVTGYLWDTESQKEAVLHAMREANRAGVRVALSLSDPFCVHRHKEDFLRIAQEHVDVLIGNREEAQALTDTGSPWEALRALARYSDLAVITMDEQGSLLRQGDWMLETPAYRVAPVDTTGAGDMFAAGILYGLTQGLPLQVTARIAAYAAAQVVAKLGPRLETLDPEPLRRLREGAGLDAV